MAEAGPIGKRLRRLEDPRLLRGEGRFADDLRPDGCLHVAFLRSPVASGRLADIETAGAGTVFTAGDIDGSCRPLAVHLTTPGALAPERPLLARDRVR
ncbi:MAG TPA: xanthine dehydrogenase family protein molybdopterin-binding subunit, partial [Candidatus Dormibacteraeota bacterium]|nr:xanthine dehydrogenase family protein molybdopterin-binding subunit [Candidatus Dormibacteraeota bacterium]